MMKISQYLMVLILITMMTSTGYASNKPAILLVVTSHSELGTTGKQTGFWLPELTHPYYKFKDAGYSVDIASIKGGTAPIDSKIFAIPEENESNQRFLQDAELMAKVLTTLPLSDIDPSTYQAVLYAGGSGPMWDFPDNVHVQRITASIYENNGVVAAVCHGPAALINVTLSNGQYLVAGKKVSAITNEEEEEEDLQLTTVHPFLLQDRLIERGAKHIYGKPWEENVVVDGRLITGQNPASASKMAEKIIAYFDQH